VGGRRTRVDRLSCGLSADESARRSTRSASRTPQFESGTTSEQSIQCSCGIPMARPGLEPGTPRFSGSLGSAILSIEGLQIGRFNVGRGSRDSVAVGWIRARLGLRGGRGVPNAPIAVDSRRFSGVTGLGSAEFESLSSAEQAGIPALSRAFFSTTRRARPSVRRSTQVSRSPRFRPFVPPTVVQGRAVLLIFAADTLGATRARTQLAAGGRGADRARRCGAQPVERGGCVRP
jgi:hypothetical protein